MADVVGLDPRRGPVKLFTVGIPVFNGRSLLRNCLQSVVNNTFPHDRYEILIADDGSTESETLAILAEFARRYSDPGFFRVISLESNSGGAARPRNRILDEASGEYVFFVDADDTIGNLTLERIAEHVTSTPADWVALHQVPVNGRSAVCRVRQPHVEVSRMKALATLTVHKVFRRAEIERQRLRFDVELPSGQDLSFAFSFILNAERFLMLGAYDYYYLTQHAGNPGEPAHLSMSANFPQARIQKNERILRSMLDALRASELPEPEQRTIVSKIVLPRVLVSMRYLTAIVRAGPREGTLALRRLSELLADPLVQGLDPAEVKGMTTEHFDVIAAVDWAGLAKLASPSTSRSRSRDERRWIRWARRLANALPGRAGRVRHRQVVHELALLRRSIEGLRDEQQRLAGMLRDGPKDSPSDRQADSRRDRYSPG